MKILIAEDDENSRQLLEAILRGNGYQVISVENGLKALQYLENEFVDLIISDILMPEMDGYGFCRAVKQNYLLQTTPFIFYTATYTAPQDEQFALSLGADRFLLKPQLLPDLLKVVNEVIKSHPTKRLNSSGEYIFNLDKQHTDRVRAKLEKKIFELDEERQKLLVSETRFRDFAEASADWFWETDAHLNVSIFAGAAPAELEWVNLMQLADVCYSHSPNEMQQTLQAQQHFADFVVCLTDKADQADYYRLSGKAVFEHPTGFVGYRGVGRNVTDMVLLNRRLEFIATHDELTGLPNRGFLKQHLENTLTKAERSGEQVLLLFFDLDNFKIVNDTLGHNAGDQLLVMAAKRITQQVRASDVLARLGGDEFVMVMPGASPQDGHRFVRDIIAAFTECFEIHEKHVYCTVSIGVSVYPDDTRDAQALMSFADLAMYRAKQNGRHNFEFYTSALNHIAHEWLEMECDLREALKLKQFYVVYQPQMDIQQQKLMGMEALIRWQHPTRGVISPLEFIKIAEQSTLIVQIGEWMLTALCLQIRSWMDQGHQIPRVSFNLSPRHIRSEGLQDTFTQILADYQIPPDKLCIELTEHALLENMDIVKANMQFLKAAGYQISLDDFGMGHSSLLCLKRWAVDEVKIDRAFIQGLVDNEGDRIIVKAIASLSTALGLGLVAEGVESQSQVDILRANGCQNMQGYFYAPPLEAAEMVGWFQSA